MHFFGNALSLCVAQYWWKASTSFIVAWFSQVSLCGSSPTIELAIAYFPCRWNRAPKFAFVQRFRPCCEWRYFGVWRSLGRNRMASNGCKCRPYCQCHACHMEFRKTTNDGTYGRYPYWSNQSKWHSSWVFLTSQHLGSHRWHLSRVCVTFQHYFSHRWHHPRSDMNPEMKNKHNRSTETILLFGGPLGTPITLIKRTE